MTPFIVSLAWGEKYRRCVPRLKRSLEKWGLPHRIVELGGEPRTPLEARRLKPSIILDWIEKLGQSVTWLDVDSEILSYPSELVDWSGDILGCRPEGSNRVWSGCIAFKSTGKALDVLERWQTLLIAERWDLDEYALKQAILEIRPVVTPLSPSYVWVEPWLRPVYPDGNPVILHGGISREGWDTLGDLIL